MDSRRLDTMGVIASGVLNIRPPKTDIPEGREKVSVHPDDDDSPTAERVVALLDKGHLVDSPEYYGLVYAWKADEGSYRGLLLQYRAISEDQTFATAAECGEWFLETMHAVAG